MGFKWYCKLYTCRSESNHAKLSLYSTSGVYLICSAIQLDISIAWKGTDTYKLVFDALYGQVAKWASLTVMSRMQTNHSSGDVSYEPHPCILLCLLSTWHNLLVPPPLTLVYH